MRNITKVRRSIRAISPVISVLLMIAIAVVASIVAYAWVMGYLGFQTEKAGNEIQIQSYTSGGNLVIYVQNTGQGVVHLKQDGSVYVNDVLKGIVNLDDIAVAPGAKMPIAMGQTVKVEVDYQNFQAGDKIRVVTVEGTVIDFSGHNSGSGSSSGGSNGPSAGFIYTGTPVINNQITFTDKSLPGKAVITSWLWDFDGTTKTAQHTTYTYDTPGDKTISLTVTDANGRTSKATLILSIATTTPTVTAPIAEFTITNTEPILNQNVPFKDASTAGSGTINQWSWTFGDGGVSSEQNPIHAYSTVGTKTITLKVTDSNAKTSTVSHTLTVVDPTQPTPTPTPTPTNNPTASPTPTPSPTPTSFQIIYSVSPAGSGTVAPTGTQTYTSSQSVPISATANNGYIFSSWTYTGSIVIVDATASQTSATVSSTGTLTANFIQSSNNKLVFTAGDAQTVIVGQPSSAITVQRQSSSGNVQTSNSLTVNLAATTGNLYSDAACTAQISSITISNGYSQATFYYKASAAGTPTITASATNYQSVSTTFIVNAAVGTQILNSSFDGSNWAEGWSYWSNPPWGYTTSQYLSSPRSIYSNSGNAGPFSCDKINAVGAKYVTISFDFKLVNTEPTDFQLRYSGTQSDNYDSVVWTMATGNLGDTSIYSSSWNHFSITVTDPAAFTSYFRIQYLSQGLSSGEAVYVDNVQVTMYT